MNLLKTKFNDFTIYYNNQFEFDFLIDEVFGTEPYKFRTKKENPIIIDCGAHIGLSVLYFKSVYPNAYIKAFEPDKRNFHLLKKNIQANNLTDVMIYNFGLADFEGDAVFYGDFSDEAESVGNTIIPEWGERPTFTQTKIKVDKLSTFIEDRPIDFLKIDTEGTEIGILKDIADKLELVKNIFVEIHEFKNHFKSLSIAKDILLKNGFKIEVSTLNVSEILSEKFPNWVSKHKPKVYAIKGSK